ncbi:MAG TPA: hypothetical protein VMF52_10125 [Steroidobacteraceae bacterium]|nr:hypothetical protein [Steroidobacteraceae bacterium]
MNSRHALLLVLVAPFAHAANTANVSCDRACLTTLADRYLAALVAHDPSKAPLARDVKIVENIHRIQPGDGLWKTASAVPTTFRIVVPDVVAQQVGELAVMQEEGRPIQLGLRLKLEGGRITEAEHVVVHKLRDEVMVNLQSPRLALTSPVIDPYRDARGRLLAIGASYYDALDLNNGSLAPFADDCVRFENGGQAVRKPVPPGPSDDDFAPFGAMSCAAQLDSQVMSYITRIDDRRVWIADEQNGLVFGLSHFRHAMDKQEIAVYGVPGVATRKLPYQPFDLPAVHVFKIWGGKIHEIEAIGFLAPFESPTGWELP